jgi:hypothetical protein
MNALASCTVSVSRVGRASMTTPGVYTDSDHTLRCTFRLYLTIVCSNGRCSRLSFMLSGKSHNVATKRIFELTCIGKLNGTIM